MGNQTKVYMLDLGAKPDINQPIVPVCRLVILCWKKFSNVQILDSRPYK